MVYTQPRICPRKWNAQNSLGYWHTNGSPNLNQTARPSHSQQKKKKRICRIVDFVVPADHLIKLKKSEKRDKNVDIASKLKKTVEHSARDTNCNWCAHYSHQMIDTRTGSDGNKKTSRDHPNNILLFRSDRILRRIRETWGDLLSLKFQWKTIS